MNLLKLLIISILFATPLCASSDDSGVKIRPLTDRTLIGTYVFATRVLLNPLAGPPSETGASRLPVECFSIGELRFDGRGGLKRRVEIRCPATANLLATGLGGPAPIGEPTAQQLQIIGSTMTSEGRYQVNADGWGSFEDTGFFRLGPVPGNPASGAGRLSVLSTRYGTAQEIAVLIDHQSLQPPGAMQLVNSDIGASFVAKRR
ncbi:MAG: hypothetical protein QNJ40_16910 [Xanthomonadales bacterium]|nr:hypothetical protein [Xanthomonadales bacterium]